MPGIVTGTEWAAYYDELVGAFGLTIDPIGPNFGTEPLLDVIADSSALATFVALIWRSDNSHPALATLRNYLGSTQRDHRDAETWTPKWAH
ncbi:MAG TPA: hypothetical protein VGP04_22135 [Pseudonocardiaceae bacterium]|jgi:hypothetical protein|nr:hypothetical protein [Pseudonocardiaceae bacterium]